MYENLVWIRLGVIVYNITQYRPRGDHKSVLQYYSDSNTVS